MKITSIILAAGTGRRMNAGKNKLLIQVKGKSVIEHTLLKFYNNSNIDDIIIVYSKFDQDFFKALLVNYPKIKLCLGGNTRSQSVKSGLKKTATDTDIVIIHDGARPFVNADIINNCIETCKTHGASVASIYATDTLATTSQTTEILKFIDRSKTIRIQTPQGFKYDDIMSAYDKITPEDKFTDDSSVYLKYVGNPHYFEGGVFNKKITYISDLELFNASPILRIGNGKDLHVLKKGVPLVLGGEKIEYEMGLMAHSDGDVVVHSIMDSILQAFNLFDIGYHFPPTDPQFKNIDSTLLLGRVKEMIFEFGTINNISCVITCQQPKLLPYIAMMKNNIAAALDIDACQVSIAATTSEKVNAEGEGKAISASAVALVTLY